MARFRSVFCMLLVAAMVAGASADTITTLFANNNRGSNGGVIYYDIDVTNAAGLNITAFDTNIWESEGFNFEVEIWTRSGTYVGNTGSNASWNMVARNSGVAAATDRPSFVDTDDFSVAFGTHGICRAPASGCVPMLNQRTPIFAPISLNSRRNTLI